MSPFVPLVSIEVEPRTRADQENLDHGLRTLMAEDPMVSTHTDRQTGRATIFGVGELQLQIVVDRLTREFNVEAAVGQPQVAYKETLTREADGDGHYAAQTDGRGQYGHVKIHVSPGQAGSGCHFTNAVVGGSIPNAFIKPIEDGIRDALTRGVLFGFPIDDVRIELYDGSYHDVDSSEATFKIAGANGIPGRGEARRAGAAGAGGAGRGCRSEGLHRWRRGRPCEPPRRPGAVAGRSFRCGIRRRAGAIFRDAWLRGRSAFADTGTCDLLDHLGGIRTAAWRTWT